MKNKPAISSGLSRKQRLERMRSTLETERSSFVTLWKDLNNYILPTRGRFTVTDVNRGDRRSKFIIDSTGTLSSRTLSSGMMSGITSPARPWFRLTTPDPDLAEHGAVKEWLYTCTERLRWILARSNFYNKAPIIYSDLGVFATAGMMSVEDDHRVVRFIDFPVGSYCFDVDENGDPAIMTRPFRMTVRQLIRKFGWENVSLNAQNLWRNGSTEAWIDVVHVIEPNEDYDPDALASRYNKPYYSCYYELLSTGRTEGDDLFLRESGFEEFPCVFPVWEVTGEDTYGTNSPGITALGDIKQLQTMEKRALHGVEKQVNPPMTGPTALRSVRASTLPGDITYVDTREGQAGFRPAHEVRLALRDLEEKQMQTRSRIERSFFADLFLMLSYMDQQGGKRDITAAEVYERHEEKLLALGPVLEQLNQRFLDPIIDRVFNMAVRRGLMPPPPPDVEGQELRTEYISMMHQAQKSQALGGLRSVIEFVLPLAERDPSTLDKLNTDRIIEHVVEAAGTPPDIVVAQDDVDKIRQARAVAARKQQEAEAAASNAAALKTMSETNTTEQNGLTDMLREVEQNPMLSEIAP